MIVIKKVEKRENVFILGFYFGEVNPTFSTTDDEDTLKVLANEKAHYLTVEGHVYVMTQDELIEHIEDLKSIMEEGSFGDAILIENFQGELMLDVVGDNGVGYLNEYDPEKENYVRYATSAPDDVEIDDVVLTIPGNFDIVRFSEDNAAKEILDYLQTNSK